MLGTEVKSYLPRHETMHSPPGPLTMELRHLRYLIAVAEERSFIAAAAKLRVAQPALSRQIRDLEGELGTPLFVRDSTGTVLTAAGEQCVQAAREILDSVGLAIDRARLAHKGLVGKCIIGAGRYPLWNGLLGRIMEQARADYPGIEVIVEEFSGEKQWQALENAEIDIALGAAVTAESMLLSGATHSVDLLDSIVVARTHPLASRESLTLDDLENETYIRYEPAVEGEASRNLQSALDRRGFAPAAERVATNADSLRMLVRAGVGWSALPRSMRHVLNAGLIAIPVEDLAIPLRYVYMHRRGDKRPAVRSILTSIRRSAERDAARRSIECPLHRDDASDCSSVPSRLELRHLRYFAAIVQHESIGRAAEALELTQPALSRQLRTLETEVGFELLTRTARGVIPTLAGESLHHDAIAILAAADRLGSEAQRALRGTAGNCVIGVVASPLAWETTSRAVAECATRLSFIEVHVEDVPTPKQAPALREARLDVAIGHRYPTLSDLDPSVMRELLHPDRMNMALLGMMHPLASRTEISLQDLVDVPFLFMKRAFSSALYDVVYGTFARAGFSPRLEGEYDGLPTVWALSAQGLGWALGSTSQSAMPPQGVVAVRLTDFDLPWGLELCYRRGESRMPVLQVLDTLRRSAHEIQTGMTSPTNKYWSAVGQNA
jgi:DNA-binding transcriptional LysR family regulator